jgi:predicted acetyltransferase|tara:strand:+ start:151 stop:468 length:318 start_codon:yes stop_codon:yes gene_type:complete
MNLCNNIILALFTILIVLYLVNLKIFKPKYCEGFKEGNDDMNLTEKVYKNTGEIAMLKEHIDKIVNIRQDIANLKTDVDTNKSSITSLMTAKEEEMNNKLDGIKL